MSTLDKISFDYDETLSLDWVQMIAKILSNFCEVWVVTARTSGETHNKDLYKVIERIGIPKERVIFTDGGMKWSILKINEFHLHFDDMEDEILEINKNTDCKGVLIGLKDAGELWYLFHNHEHSK